MQPGVSPRGDETPALPAWDTFPVTMWSPFRKLTPCAALNSTEKSAMTPPFGPHGPVGLLLAGVAVVCTGAA